MVFGHMNTGLDSSKHIWGNMKCFTCKGSGEITQEHADRIEAGGKVVPATSFLWRNSLRGGETTGAYSGAIERNRDWSCAK